MSLIRRRLCSCFATLVFGVASLAAGQAAPANTDILKMIQAGLPESTVVNKIREGAGKWDTSVDALIVLKQAGATEVEMNALTSVPPSIPTTQPVEAFGGQILHTRSGDPFLVFPATTPGIFPDGKPNNSVLLINYEGQPAILIPSTIVMNFGCFPGNMVVTRTDILFDPYVSICGFEKKADIFRPEEIGKKGNVVYRLPLRYSREAFLTAKVGKDHLYGKGVLLHEKYPYGDAFFIVGVYPFLQTAPLVGTPTDTTSMRSAAMTEFFMDLLHDFDGMLTQFETASGISNPSRQLSTSATYQVLSPQLRERYRTILQQRLDETKSGGNSWLALAQGVQATQQITAGLMNSAVGISTGNASQFSAGVQAMAGASGAQIDTTAIATQPKPNVVAPTPPKATGFTYDISHGQLTNGIQTTKTTTATQPKAIPNAGGTSIGVNTGTAAPANCVAVNVEGPCAPLAQYQQTQVQQQTSGQGVCPASGFVPGVMLRQTSDVAVGVPCKPGTPYGPLIATTASGGYTGVTPPDPATAGPSGLGSSGSNTGGPYDPDLNNCVVYFYKNDPITGDHLILQNNCSVRAQVYFYAGSQVYGGAAIDPGATDNTYASHDKILAAGALSIYACPVNDIPRKPDGTLAYNGLNNRFLCSQK